MRIRIRVANGISNSKENVITVESQDIEHLSVLSPRRNIILGNQVKT